MGGLPDLLFVIDTNKEDDRDQGSQAAQHSGRRRSSTPTAIPDGITFPIPGNDDAGRAIALYCDLIARAAIDGISRAQGEAGVDLGAAEKPPVEAIAEAPKAECEKFEPLPGPHGAADDLKKLHRHQPGRSRSSSTTSASSTSRRSPRSARSDAGQESATGRSACQARIGTAGIKAAQRSCAADDRE